MEAVAHETTAPTSQTSTFLPSLQRIGAADLLSTWWNSRSEKTNPAYKQDIE